MARKGSKNIISIPAEILSDLEAGKIESASLSEGLAINHARLLENCFPKLPAIMIKEIDKCSELGVKKRVEKIAEILFEHLDEEGIEDFKKHKSDSIRSFACFMIPLINGKDIIEKIDLMKDLADDTHFGVREWSWLALRNEIISDLDRVLEHFKSWTLSEEENIRRFASEATRPRGVWCAHIKSLKDDPEPGLIILEPLKSDSSLYVRNSVANWLNDASKTQAPWVEDTCRRWLEESDTGETRYICKRARRSIK